MVDALGDCEFGEHGAHVLAIEAPTIAENVLTPQLTQALEPDAAEYVLLEQLMQLLAEAAE
jgi:hypothetical protein